MTPEQIKKMKSNRNEYFFRRWNEVITTIEYSEEWEIPKTPQQLSEKEEAKRIPYHLGGAHHDEHVKALRPGEVARAMDDHGRKIILVGTRFGTVLIYPRNRFGFDMDLGGVFPERLVKAGVEYSVSTAAKLGQVIGGGYYLVNENNPTIFRNIGERIELIARVYNDPDFKPTTMRLHCTAEGKRFDY